MVSEEINQDFFIGWTKRVGQLRWLPCGATSRWLRVLITSHVLPSAPFISHCSCWQKHSLLLPYFGLRTFCWSWWADRFPPRLFWRPYPSFWVPSPRWADDNAWDYIFLNNKTMVPSTMQMSVSCAEVEFILSPPKARSRASNVSARCVTHTFAAEHRLHQARTLEAWQSRSRLALNLHLPAAQTVPATHVGDAPPCAARTCLLRSRRRRSASSSYCTLFNNRCVLSACSCVSQNTHRRRASAVRFSAFRLPNPPQTRYREVHGGLRPRHYPDTQQNISDRHFISSMPSDKFAQWWR